MRLARTALLLLGLLGPSAAGAEDEAPAPIAGEWLGSAWVIEPDGSYSTQNRHWRWKPPAARRGFFAHGAVPDYDGWDDRVTPEVAGACQERILKEGDRADPELRTFWFSDFVSEEFWYFEAGGEALLLVRQRSVAGVDDCRPRFRDQRQIQRAVIGEHSFLKATLEDDGSWRTETRYFSEHLNDRNDIYANDHFPRLETFLMRKRRLGDSDVGGEVGNVRTHCVSFSSPPDAGGQQCWVARGPARGVVAYQLEFIAGSPFVVHQLDDLRSDVELDGRLFEWDRRITPGDAE